MNYGTTLLKGGGEHRKLGERADHGKSKELISGARCYLATKFDRTFYRK